MLEFVINQLFDMEYYTTKLELLTAPQFALSIDIRSLHMLDDEPEAICIR